MACWPPPSAVSLAEFACRRRPRRPPVYPGPLGSFSDSTQRKNASFNSSIAAQPARPKLADRAFRTSAIRARARIQAALAAPRSATSPMRSAPRANSRQWSRDSRKFRGAEAAGALANEAIAARCRLSESLSAPTLAVVSYHKVKPVVRGFRGNAIHTINMVRLAGEVDLPSG